MCGTNVLLATVVVLALFCRAENGVHGSRRTNAKDRDDPEKRQVKVIYAETKEAQEAEAVPGAAAKRADVETRRQDIDPSALVPGSFLVPPPPPPLSHAGFPDAGGFSGGGGGGGAVLSQQQLPGSLIHGSNQILPPEQFPQSNFPFNQQQNFHLHRFPEANSLGGSGGGHDVGVHFGRLPSEASFSSNPLPADASRLDFSATQQHPSVASFGNSFPSDNEVSVDGEVQLPPYVSSDEIAEQTNDIWPRAANDIPKIVDLDVKCEKNLMKVTIQFDKPFQGSIFSKGHYRNVNCVHVPAGLGRTISSFDISINSCGTVGKTDGGSHSGSGTYFDNIIVIQYDSQVQEVWDQARRLRCTWHDQYEKSVTFRPFSVDTLDVIRADFAGDNVGCWMQIQVGKGPWAPEVSGLVKIGQTMTMALAIKDDENKFDMLVRNCMAHDGKRAPIQLVDHKGCVTRPKLMSKFMKIKNFGASASVLSYSFFHAFKFPDSMEVHFQCTIQICRFQCPEQCSQSFLEPRPANSALVSHEIGLPPQSSFLPAGRPRDDNRAKREASLPATATGRTAAAKASSSNSSQEAAAAAEEEEEEETAEVGINKLIRVVSTGDLAFSLEGSGSANVSTLVVPVSYGDEGLVCMTKPGFVASLVVLMSILVVSCLLSAFLCIRHKAVHDKSRAYEGCGGFPVKKIHF